MDSIVPVNAQPHTPQTESAGMALGDPEVNSPTNDIVEVTEVWGSLDLDHHTIRPANFPPRLR